MILHRGNFGSSAQLRSITKRLQRAAAAGGQPPLLIAVDQEGGSVKIVPWVPPTRAPAAPLGADARADGRSTGAALLELGVNTDFAPVADVPGSTDLVGLPPGTDVVVRRPDHRAPGRRLRARTRRTRTRSREKHFPGLGLATREHRQLRRRDRGSAGRLARASAVPAAIPACR